MSLKRVLSIQSHVVSGYVGNKSAVFPLHLHGFKVDAINSVQLSNHTQYPNVAGQILKDKDVWEIYEALKKNGINKYSHVTTGYVGDPTFLKTVVAVVNDLKQVNPDILYVCDPVMGDNGAFYVPESMLEVYRNEILSIADVLLPNQFEAEQLSGMKIENEEDGWKVCDWFHAQGNISTVIITSGDIGADPDRMLCLASIKKGTQRIRMEIPRIPASFTGSGDLFSASFLIWSHILAEDAKLALEQTVNTTYAVLIKTYDNFKDMKDVTSSDKELRIIESLKKLHAIESAMRTWMSKTCIMFREKLPTDTSYVKFSNQNGCFATVGQGEGEQIVSIGKGCGTPGFALHELAHVIGFFHEQSRPDRDDWVDIIWDNIREDKKEQFSKFTSVDIESRGIPYDYLSITHYGPYDFRKNPGLETVHAKGSINNPADMGQRRYLSDYDVIGANVMYQCTQHLEEQCKFGTRYIDSEVEESKEYACQTDQWGQIQDEWTICLTNVKSTKKMMVCNWNTTLHELNNKNKQENKDKESVYKYGNIEHDPFSTPEPGRCMQNVPVEKTVREPCGDGSGELCDKTVTVYEMREGSCWGVQDDDFKKDEVQWSTWSPWSACSKKCARGVQLRFRMCTTASNVHSTKCPGYSRGIRMCCNGPCYREVVIQQPYNLEEPVKVVQVIARKCPPIRRPYYNPGANDGFQEESARLSNLEEEAEENNSKMKQVL